MMPKRLLKRSLKLEALWAGITGTRRLGAMPCSASSVFSPELLSRATMPAAECDKFRDEAKMVVLRDPLTDARAVCYQHPDGRVLLDAIRLPQNSKLSQPDL